VRCFSFHEIGLRALSEGLDIPNAIAILAKNLSKDCIVPPGDTYSLESKSLERQVLHLERQFSADSFEISLNLIDTSQGSLNIGQYILRPNAFQEI